MGLVTGAEGNLSTFDGRTLAITRTESSLAALRSGDVLLGGLEGPFPDASRDVDVHRAMYRARGPGAVAHAHPPGTVPEDGGGPGMHGVYVFAPSLEQAVEEVVREVREGPAGGQLRAEVPAVLEWDDGVVRILDQRGLPATERFIEARDAEMVAEAIRTLAVRGAPLLGVAGAFGLAVAARRSGARGPKRLLTDLERAGRVLVGSRPTAANLGWAVDRVLAAARRAAAGAGAAGVRAATLAEARAVLDQEQRSCADIGRLGSALVPAGANVMTHCNSGTLATGGIGTAQGVITAAHRAGKAIHVWVNETRPVLQGARLTAWELRRAGVPMTLVPDSAAGALMADGMVNLVIVGADRIAANGDSVNKLGTYQLAVLARHHGIPFYVAAPMSTFDPATPAGRDIEIEQRDPREVTTPFGVPFAPEGTPARNAAFDVTPASLITAIVTELGVGRPPFRRTLGRWLAAAESEAEAGGVPAGASRAAR
jgi:methylthioribose-1-phosphate isomerase